MITLRRAAERGHANHGWLDTYYSFSFSGYYDPRYMGFRALRVINEDRVAAGKGFPTHGHENMEIVTYVLSGALQHRDSLGNGAVLRPGELQRITAGKGIEHSEFNPDAALPVHLYQIWLLPAVEQLPPSYEQRAFPAADRHNVLQLVASPDGRDGSLTIHQDARILLAELDAGRKIAYSLGAGRHAWLQVIRGSVMINDQPLQTSDAAAVSDEQALTIQASASAEIMLFDLA